MFQIIKIFLIEDKENLSKQTKTTQEHKKIPKQNMSPKKQKQKKLRGPARRPTAKGSEQFRGPAMRKAAAATQAPAATPLLHLGFTLIIFG